MKKFVMSEEAFNELINGFEIVGKLTDYGRKNIKYHVQKLQRKNKELEQALDEIENILNGIGEMACYSKSMYLDGEDVEDILEIVQKAKGDAENENNNV